MDRIVSVLNKTISYLASNTAFDPQSKFFQLALIFLAVVVLSFFVNFFLVNSVLGSGYRMFVAPGIVVHEFSHAIFCVLTGAKITKISLFDKKGGSVTHQKSKIPIIGPLLISFAPFAIGAILIVVFARWLGVTESSLTSIQPNVDSVIQFMNSAFHQVNITDWRNWLILYLAVSIAVTMTPSRQDILNVIFSLIFLGLLAYYLFQVRDIQLNLDFLPIEKIITLLSIAVILLILSLVLSMIIFALSKVIKK